MYFACAEVSASISMPIEASLWRAMYCSTSTGTVWTLFENSRVLHAPTPGKVKRPTIELDIVPALRTTTVPNYAGINGWYPLFPWTSREL